MKICSYCSAKVQEDEGTLDEEGNFVCTDCSGENTLDEEDAASCPECEESSEEYEEQGVCPSCGYSKSSGEDRHRAEKENE